mmetsp:Transcript_84195/g.136474  ORF Transcript_84195/g.136474 Transcript_84195/m.136474 type:complete len:155 (+) Transcript_84195:29-493(+)
MDERDFDKAATRLRKETARGSPPPASSGGAASTAQTPAHVEAGHTSMNQAPRSYGWTPSVRPVPSLVELCTRSLVETKLTYCETMHDIPDHVAAEIVYRIMDKGLLTPPIARKMLTSNSDEIVEFAGVCLDNLNAAEIAAGPLTAKGTHGGCRP